jgi:hypothetical protein
VTPKKNTLFLRFMFQSRSQKEEESAEEFFTQLEILVKNCGYQDDMVRD